MNTRKMLSVAALLACLMAPAAASASEQYVFSAELAHKGGIFAKPSAVVRSGEPATMHVSGPNGYTLALTVRESSAGRIEVAAAVDTPHGTMAPTVVVEPGSPASVRVGDLGLTLTVKRRNG